MINELIVLSAEQSVAECGHDDGGCMGLKGGAGGVGNWVNLYFNSSAGSLSRSAF